MSKQRSEAATELRNKRQRIITLLRRAQDNKQLATTKQARDIANNQCSRAYAMLLRINNAITIERENTRQAHERARTQKLVRVRHPITHRYVTTTQEQHLQWQPHTRLRRAYNENDDD